MFEISVPVSDCPGDEALSLYLAGEEIATDVEAHLAACSLCRSVARIAAYPEDEAEAEDAHRFAQSGGRYELLREIGTGGQSVVWEAFDRVLMRDVALKEIAGPRDPERAIARFVREARITAALQHPNIVPMYDLVREDDGSVYFCMRRIDGETLANATRECASLTARLGLLPHVLDACQAMAFAHKRGFVHRDIKPQNIMIGEFGDTIVVDWGLAKSLSQRDDNCEEVLVQESDQLTLVGSTLGTPAYMSPEQGCGDLESLDKRTDVWCLGAVLYQLLTGQPPYAGANTNVVLRKATHADYQPVLTVCPTAPKELAAICARAMATSPVDRYQDAQELLEDLAGYLSGQQVNAYTYSTWEAWSLFYRSHKTAIRALGLVFAAVSVALLVISFAFASEGRARRRALQAANAASQSAQTASEALLQAHLNKAEDLARDGFFLEAQLHADRAEALVSELPTKRAGSESRLNSLRLQANQQPMAQFHRHTEPRSQEENTSQLASSAEGEVLICLSGTTLGLFDTASGNLHGGFELPTASRTVASHGKNVLVGHQSNGGALLYDAQGELIEEFLSGEAPTTAMAVSPKGDVVLGDSDGVIWIFAKGQSKSRRVPAHAGGILAITISPDGASFASAGSDKAVRHFRIDSGRPLGKFTSHTQWVTGVAFSEDGESIISSSLDRSLQSHAGVHSKTTFVGERGLNPLTSDTSRRRLVVADAASEVRIFSADLAVIAAVRASTSIDSVAVTSGGSQLVTAGRDCALDWWKLRTIPEVSTDAEVSYNLAVSSDGKQIAIPSFDGVVSLWTPSTGAVHRLDTGHDAIRRVALEGDILATLSMDDRLDLFNTRTFEKNTEFNVNDNVRSMALHPSDGRVFFGTNDGEVLSWQPGTTPETIAKLPAFVAGLAISPDGSLLAMVDGAGDIQLWSFASANVNASFSTKVRISEIRFSSEGAQLTAAGNGSAWVLDGRSLALVQTIPHPATWVNAAVVANDGRWLITTSFDAKLRIFDVASGALLANIPSTSTTFAIDPKGQWWAMAQERVVSQYAAPWIGSLIAPRFPNAAEEAGQHLEGFEVTWTSKEDSHGGHSQAEN